MPVVLLAPVTCAVYEPGGSVRIIAESALSAGNEKALTLDITVAVAG